MQDVLILDSVHYNHLILIANKWQLFLHASFLVLLLLNFVFLNFAEVLECITLVINDAETFCDPLSQLS